jgi:L-lactate dehydrogenase complex protein LldF
MSNDFRKRIRKSIADENLQIALDNNAQRRRDGRLTAFASVPDYQERRAHAHAIKANVVAHLDDYLEKFLSKVEANGIIVHRAKDADEAIQIVLDIIGNLQQPPKNGDERTTSIQREKEEAFVPLRDLSGKNILVAKSKSMVSEEINLNHALAEHNIRAIETDLGEYIVQLRGERPSHIITPAVHLRRGDVGKLFEEKLGLPYTEEIPVLTNTARKVLREVFLTADVGLSGVNFGVAETGTLCIVTNEGNGRMCTTVPPVHIALMGMERVVPTMDDLALFLSLLPRSATGQKLSVYTNLINSPLPGQTRHLIVLDNGRSALRASPLVESLYCIRCGACLNTCPVFRELGGHAYGSIYPGPIGSVISSALVDPKFAYLSQASSLCGACKEACPVDIDLPSMLLKIRAGENVKRGESGVGLPAPVKLGLKLFGHAAASPRLFTFGQRTLGLLPLPKWIRIPAFTGWGYSKDFPRPAARPFRARWKRLNHEETMDAKKSIELEEPTVAEKPILKNTNLIEQFATELHALGGKVIRVTKQDASTQLEEFLRERGIDRVLVDDAGTEYITKIASIREPDPSIRVGVTGALCGIAETGSVVLTHGAGHTLTASLLPEIHVAMLKTSQLLPTVASALTRPEIPHAAAGVIISGPSRTADIEMTLTIGVHGPGELHVFLIDDSTGV